MRARGGGRTCFVAFASHWTVDHVPLSRRREHRSCLLLIERQSPTFGRSFTFQLRTCTAWKSCALSHPLPVLPSAVSAFLLGQRSFFRFLSIIPFRTAVPFWGQTARFSSSLSPKRDCGPNRVDSGRVGGDRTYVKNVLLLCDCRGSHGW